MHIEATAIDGVVKIIPKRHIDKRGYFCEVFKESWFREHVADISFSQENESLSTSVGVIRGLHFQTAPFAQGKLVRCLQGTIFDVAVDIRRGSKTFGQWVGEELTPENGVQLWVPSGFAHGFATLSPNSVIGYKVTAPYSPENECGIKWNDPDIGIIWPFSETEAILSDKDRQHVRLSELPEFF